MAEVTMSITRTHLGLPLLALNDHVNYALANNSFGGGANQWQIQWADSKYVDGQVMVSRKLGNVQDTFSFWVTGANHAEVVSNIQQLIQAFSQETFTLTIQYEGNNHQYECYAADHSIERISAHYEANQIKVTFTVPRRPLPTTGV